MTEAEITQRTYATVNRADLPTTVVRVEFAWRRSDPAIIHMRVEQSSGTVTWELSRGILVGSMTAPLRGAWLGVGLVRYFCGEDGYKMCMYPGRRPTFLKFEGPTLREFVEHTQRVTPSHGIEERVIIGAQMNRAIEKILG